MDFPKRIISAENLLKRWAGIGDEGLMELAFPAGDTDPILLPYWHKTTTINDDGIKKHHLKNEDLPYPLDPFASGGPVYEWTSRAEESLGIVFSLDEVEELEKIRPEYKGRAVTGPDLTDDSMEEPSR